VVPLLSRNKIFSFLFPYKISDHLLYLNATRGIKCMRKAGGGAWIIDI